MTEPLHDAAAIRAWLRNNPDFLLEQPELLAELVIPHPAGATSLIERQVEVLRAENRLLGRKLEHLTGMAGQNEQLMQRLHRLSLRLVTSPSLGELAGRLQRALNEDFQADAVRLILDSSALEDAAGPGLAALPDSRPEWLSSLLEQAQPQCGRLTQAKRSLLFGQDADRIGSAALVPVGTLGILAIGAESDERFQPDMGTLFLSLLGDALAFRLADTQPGRTENRAQA
jgi:uncharacterized protein YigA (DUF484 family)